jgi:hypothetical protein
MKIYLLIALLAFVGSACGPSAGEGPEPDISKPLAVEDLNLMRKEKPHELNTKYLGQKLVVLGTVNTLPNDDPAAYDTFAGFQVVALSGSTSGYPIDCQVSRIEGEKFKDVAVGDIVTVTGTLKLQELTMALTNCAIVPATK